MELNPLLLRSLLGVPHNAWYRGALEGITQSAVHRIADDLMFLNDAEIVEVGQQEGSIRKDLYVGLVKRFILGGVDEVINTWLHSDGSYDLCSMADPLVDLFMSGIRAGEA